MKLTFLAIAEEQAVARPLSRPVAHGVHMF